MLIEKLRIAGFKSFRQETSFDLTSGMNVIVGPNGAGKSNIISAIQFALTNEYRKCTAIERKKLLYNGREQRDQEPAFVEITINNGDRRLPVESDVVILKRIFGTAKDRLLVNGRPFQDIQTFLESAGFTSSYFVVKQGKISALTTTTDQQRLHFLKEIAGINSYDSSMKRIQQSLKEADINRNEIEVRGGEINERIKVLENQRTELEKVASLDMEKRSIEYVIVKKEYKELQGKLSSYKQELQEKLDEYRVQVQPKEGKVKSLITQIITAENMIRLKVSQVNQMKSEKLVKDVEIEHLNSKLFRHQPEVLDLNDEIEKAKGNLEQTISESEKLQKSMDVLTSRLNNEKYQELLKSELEANKKYAKAEAQLKCMELNMTRASIKGATSSSHQKSLKEESAIVQGKISKLIEGIKGIETSMTAHTTELVDLEANSKRCTDAVEGLYSELPLIMNGLKNEVTMLQNLTQQRAVLYKEENTLKAKAAVCFDRKANAKESLRKAMGWALYYGWEGIVNIAIELYGNQSEDEDPGYYGTVLDNIECDEQLYTAVEVTGGSRLLHFIVKNHSVSRALMQVFNQRKLRGEVNFISLDSLSAPRTSSFREDTSPDAPIRLLRNSVRISENSNEVQQAVLPAVQFVFGNTLLCQTFEMAKSASKNHKVNCVTIDGDKTHRSGPITGGYINSSTSKIRAYTELASCIEKIEVNSDKLVAVQAKIENIQNEIKTQTGKLEQKETQKNRTQLNIDQENCKKRVLHLRIRELQNLLAKDTKDLNTHRVRLTEFETEKHMLEKQSKQPLFKPSELSSDALSQIQGLRERVKALGGAAKLAFQKRMESEKHKMAVQNELENLYEAQAAKPSFSEANVALEDLKHRQENVQSILETTKEALENVERDRSLFVSTIEKSEESLQKAMERVTNYKDEKKRLMAEISKGHPLESNLQCTVNATEEKLKDVSQKLKTFATIPSNVNSYLKKSMNLLYKQLRKVNKELEKYNALCRLPEDVHASLDEIQEEISTTQAELDQGFQRIREVGEFIASHKQQRLLHFFRILQRNFRQVFLTIVPEGRANLILSCRDFDIENMDEDSALPEVAEGDMVGVKISAYFSTARDASTVKDMAHLSGGQKSVIAVALILAIQKLDPIPIYLFDEIDSALDTDYREAVAHVIDEMSSRVQFVCTTHRAEFVEVAKNHIAVAFHNTSSIAQKIAPAAAMSIVKKCESEPLTNSISDPDSTDNNTSLDVPARNGVNTFGDAWVHPADNSSVSTTESSDNDQQSEPGTETANLSDAED